MPENDAAYLEIDGRLLGLGVVGGVLASLWTVIPFFWPGAPNLWFFTVSIGIIVVALFENDKLFKGLGIAAVTFLVMSYVAVPVTAGAVLGGEPSEPVQAQEGTETVTLSVPDLFCQGCTYSVQSALEGMNGVKDASASMKTKEAVVVYNPDKITPQQIVQNPTVQGYGGTIKTKG